VPSAAPSDDPAGSRPATRRRRYKAPLEIRLKRRTRRLRQLHGFVLEEFGERQRVPLRLRLAALRHGFSSLHWRLYDLDRNDPGDYLPSFADLDYGLDSPHRLALRDKLTFALAMERLEVPCPRALAYVERGRVLDLGADEAPGGSPTLAALARKHGGVVVKPVSGGAGRGVVLVTCAGETLLANGQPVDDAELARLSAAADGLLVSELVSQGGYAAAIAPRAVNTVRLLTLWDGDAPFVAAAAHRFGLPRTYPIDNFHGGKGGLSAPIDVETGVLGTAATLDADGALQRLGDHPDSGARIAGTVVPGWDAVVATTLRVAWRLPHLPFVGWDLVVTDRGPVYLEANAPPGTLVWQVHGGLLRDPRVRRACARLGLR